MTPFTFADESLPIDDRVADTYRRAWQRLARPGTWFTGEERVALAAEVRQAPSCALCQERKAALSPHGVAGGHDWAARPGSELLPEAAVEVVHRVVTDPARLSRPWFESVTGRGPDGGLSVEHYVEILGVVTSVLSIDVFCVGLGLALEPLPDPVGGKPSRRRPPGAAMAGAWVPMLAPDRLDPVDADLFGGARRAGNVLRALSLVPDEVRGLFDLSAAQYVAMRDFYRFDLDTPLSRAQMELLAARVSALNECFY